MGKNFLFLGWALLLFLTAACGSSGGGGGADNRFGVPFVSLWTKESGIRVAGGVSTSAIHLADGRWRIFYPSMGGIGSSISEDGINFTPEEGQRVAQGTDPADLDFGGAKDPDIIQEDSFWRMYYTGVGGDDIHRCLSATSTDGWIWTKEAGARVDYESTYSQRADVPSAVKISATNYKMYFVYDWYGDNSLKGATSTDGLNWTVFSLTGFLRDSMDPEVVTDGSGGLIMYFAAPRYSSGHEPMDIYKATSTDGIAWTVVGQVIKPEKSEEGQLVGDPDIVQLLDGTYRLYYYGMTGPESSNILSATAASR